MAPHVDFLVGNQSDFDDSLGYVSDKVPKKAPFETWLDTYARLLRRVASDYPNLKLIGTQLTGALTADRIHWGAVLFDTGTDALFTAPARENIEIADRTGGGDSFVSGVAAALLRGHDVNTAVQWGAAHGILVQETPGDTTMIDEHAVLAEVRAPRQGRRPRPAVRGEQGSGIGYQGLGIRDQGFGSTMASPSRSLIPAPRSLLPAPRYLMPA